MRTTTILVSIAVCLSFSSNTRKPVSDTFVKGSNDSLAIEIIEWEMRKKKAEVEFSKSAQAYLIEAGVGR